MYIKKIHLLYYRNYEALDLTFSKGVNLIYGDNAQGKTNILEAIYLCGTGKSHRTNNDKELIYFGKPAAKVEVELQKEISDWNINVLLSEKEKKKVQLNGVQMPKIADLLGNLHVVMFSPEDLGLIKSGPADRRRFMDIELCQLKPRYFYDLTQYNKVLKQRNNLLKEIKYNQSLRDTLFAWDAQLSALGKRIIFTRSHFIEKLAIITKKIHYSITSGKEELITRYESNVSAEDFEKKLEKNVERDILRGSTSVGPHKDDILFSIGDLDLRTYGSQGQQRSAALSVKLAELEFVKQEIGEYPVLLLDDVMSELDAHRQNDLLQNLKEIQTIVTGTGIDAFHLENLDEVAVFYVKQGAVRKEQGTVDSNQFF